MASYKAPLRDIQFVRDELLKAPDFYQSVDTWKDVSPDLISAVLEECAKFAENVLSPLNATGDQQGCTLADGKVSTPTGFKDAYHQFVEGGWPALEALADHGGQGMPKSMGISVTEMIGTANWSWGMYTGLSKGAVFTITEHGSEEQKSRYLGPLVSGEWTGTMCLTESHCGSDLGLLRTRAEPQADGSYRITGTKIFISSGDHDMADNIVHIVLARLPNAPKGTKGISLFIVPKVLVNADGSLGARNAVNCGALEHKMGIHGNATCVMNFDGATGYLIGPENRGLNCMFTFMNTARIGTACQGLAHAELSYQNSLAYAKDRLQMRSMTRADTSKDADPIIIHPDVRRMLLTQRVFAEGGRMLIYYISLVADQMAAAQSDSERERFDQLLALLTPIAKAFMTETGFESANLGMQIFGGHGYIREWGMEQNVRDARISMLYEGTTGIQALDLLGRKILMGGGKILNTFIEPIAAFCKEQQKNPAVAGYVKELNALINEWGELTMAIGAKAMQNPDEVNAACVDYLMYSGYVTYAYFFAQAAVVAQAALDAGNGDDFYRGKLYLTQFYFQRILPRTRSLAVTMQSGADNLLSARFDPFTG